jgi:hypothetical protein
VLVRGTRLSEIEFDLQDYVRDFVLEVAAPAQGRGYARWHRRMCAGVFNLQNEPAQYIVDRISGLAEDVGLEAGEPGCIPDVVILFTVDARYAANYLVENNPRVFRPGGPTGGMSLSRDALREFAESERAVRWWHVSLPVDARTGQLAIQISSVPGIPVISVPGASRIASAIRDDMSRVIIIVDSTKLTGTTWQEIGDYLAFISLAQISPNAAPAAFDSILNLFSNPTAYSGLTDWDRSYIRALYDIDLARRPKLQRNALVSRIVGEERDLVE